MSEGRKRGREREKERDRKRTSSASVVSAARLQFGAESVVVSASSILGFSSSAEEVTCDVPAKPVHEVVDDSTL